MASKKRPSIRRTTESGRISGEGSHGTNHVAPTLGNCNQPLEDFSNSVEDHGIDASNPHIQISTSRKRGRARSLALERLQPGETFFVNIRGSDAVGINSEKFQSELGILTRSIIPICVKDFRVEVTSEMKEALLRRLKEMSTRNKSNRANLQIPNHRMGRQNLNQLGHDLEKRGVDVNRKELFMYSKSRAGPNGSRVWHDEEHKKKYDLMCRLTTRSSEGNDSVLSVDDAYLQATGKEHPGRVRGVGRGVNPTLYYRGGQFASNVALERRMDKIERHLEEQAKSISLILKMLNRQQEGTSSQPLTGNSSAGSGFGKNANHALSGDEENDEQDDGYSFNE